MNFDESMLVSMLKKNESVAYEHLVELYADKIYRTALFMLTNNEDAKDAVQDVFLSVHKNIRKFRSESSLSTWIYRITVNSCISIGRKRNNTVSISSVADLRDEHDALLTSVDRMIVRDAILSLKDGLRTVIVLRDINGLSYETISRILRLPTGTVKSRINRARSELRSILAKNLPKGDECSGLQ